MSCVKDMAYFNMRTFKAEKEGAKSWLIYVYPNRVIW